MAQLFRLNGTKRFITNAPEAGLLAVMARSNQKEVGAKGITAFLVEAHRREAGQD